MATLTPAKAIRVEHVTGCIRPGLLASHIVAINTKDFSCQLLSKRPPAYIEC